MDPLTSLKVFIIAVVSFTLVAAFRRFILETPPNTPSDRFLLLVREIIGSVFVGMVATFQWSAFYWLEIARNTCVACCSDWHRISRSDGSLKKGRQRQFPQFIDD